MIIVALVPTYLVVWIGSYIATVGWNFDYIDTYFRHGWSGGESSVLIQMYSVLVTLLLSPFIAVACWKWSRRR